MEGKEQEVYAVRENKQSRYDKRLIAKVVKEVENGLPRKEANRIYGLGKATLDGWMRDFASVEYRQNLKRRNYTNLQKRTIVTAIEQGRLTVKEAKTTYNIETERIIRNWIFQHKLEKVEIHTEKNTPMVENESPEQDLEKEALQRALKEAELKITALNTLIDVAEDQLKIDIRKKSGAKQS